MESNLHPIFQQVLAPFARPAPTIKQQVRDALAHGSDLVIEHNGDTWRVVCIGSGHQDGSHYCHLASTTRFQRPPFDGTPVQTLGWVSDDVLAEALARHIR